MDHPQCPKCHRAMEEGFVVDMGRNHAIQPSWSPGPPKRSFWTGLKLDRNALRPVTTYRCTACGYLESYTRLYA
jgi:predicted nucleic-acid-binding Zn-ribbon protein